MMPENLELVFVWQSGSKHTIGKAPGAGASATRLAHLAGVTPEYLREKFRHAALLDGAVDRKAKFDYATATKRAPEYDQKGRALILMGNAVAKCFAMHKYPLMDWRQLPGGAAAAVIPHTSALSLRYNDPSVRAEVAGFLHEVLAKNPPVAA